VAEPTKADYGLDAPGVVVGNAVAGTAALAGAGIGWAALRRRHRGPAAVLGGWLAAWGLVAVAQVGLMIRSRAGKLTERDRLLDQLPWRGDEWVLDVGCGRGLLGAAKRLTSGRAVGLDLWRTRDQAGNDPAATMANAQAEGVAERVELRDGDARQLRSTTGASTWSSPAWPCTTSPGAREGRSGQRARARAQAGRPPRHPRFPPHQAVCGGVASGRARRHPMLAAPLWHVPTVRVVTATKA
jgi:hypothetical protein